MGFKILHLSDIHMNFMNYDTNRMRDKFYQYINNVAHDVDFIVITGDNVYQHGNYETAKEFYNKVKSAVPNNTEFIIVPGNHDVDRSDKSRINSIRGLRGSIDNIDDIHDSNILKSLISPFGKYFTCIETVFPNKFSQIPVQVYTSGKCDFILINTALTSFEKNEDGHLLIDITSLETSLKYQNNNKPIIVIGHHTLDSFDPGIKSRVQNLFLEYNIKLYLCGHTHKMEIADYLVGNPTAQLVSGAGIVDKYSTNGFYLIEYSNTQYDIYAYAYKMDKEKWDIIDCLNGFTNGKHTHKFIDLLDNRTASLTEDELLYAECSQYIVNNEFEKAKKLLIKHGRVWLEAVGLTKCKDMLDAVPKNEKDYEIVYLQGLASLFQGKYVTARNLFQKAVKNIEDGVIKYCFETEAAECSRRLGDFKDAINILNPFNEDILDDSYWSGVVYELIGHFSKQFDLAFMSAELYNKAITIFEKRHSTADQIEKWHCLYSSNQLDRPVAMSPENKPGGFLKGLYYLTNAKYNAVNGKMDDAIRCVNESISSFKIFQSDIYQNRACVLKLLIFISSQEVENIDKILDMLSSEELERVRHEERLYNFIRTFDNSYINKCFSDGYCTKAKAMMAIMRKYNPLVNIITKYESTVVIKEKDGYILKQNQIDYSEDIAESRLLSAIIGYM
jgi:predicted MPP superfamily phosphohydrolase/tetratricopeptide (TPR) repeat protein